MACVRVVAPVIVALVLIIQLVSIGLLPIIIIPLIVVIVSKVTPIVLPPILLRKIPPLLILIVLSIRIPIVLISFLRTLSWSTIPFITRVIPTLLLLSIRVPTAILWPLLLIPTITPPLSFSHILVVLHDRLYCSLQETFSRSPWTRITASHKFVLDMILIDSKCSTALDSILSLLCDHCWG